MIVSIYAGRRRGTFLASFDPLPGLFRFDVVVPGGSRILETSAGLDRFKALFVPTSDPMQLAAWSAADAFFDAREGRSRFRIIRPRKVSGTAS